MRKEQGQVVVILLLIVMIALAIALSVVGRSVTEIQTADKTENSSRAFSAAEAGIERGLTQYSQIGTGNPGSLDINDLSSNATATVLIDPKLPTPGSGILAGQALEYPTFGKESFAQFWLVEPSLIDNNLNCQQENSRSFGQGQAKTCYNQSSFLLYFGDTTADYILKPENKPAIEVNIISQSGSGGNLNYLSKKYYFDSFDGLNTSSRNSKFSGCRSLNPSVIDTASGTARKFYCQVQVPTENDGAKQAVLVRVKFVYTNLSHPLALQPECGNSSNQYSCSLPPQVNTYKSTGKSGDTKRQLQLFRQKAVMPSLFDYALLSAGEIEK